MNIVGWIALIILADILIGCFVLAMLDTDKSVLEWIDKDPTPFQVFTYLLVIFWPIPAFLMIRCKLNNKDLS